MRGTHQSSGLSEISSQFHDECSAVPGRFCIDRCGESGAARRNFVFGPLTLTTGCRPIVLVTTPPQPASKARMMLLSDSVGGADDSRNGFSNSRPVNVTDRSAAIRQSIAPLAPPRRSKDRESRFLTGRVPDDLLVPRRCARQALERGVEPAYRPGVPVASGFS